MNNINETLSYISKLLNENSIEYWADSGTLLGIMREGELLKHDPDIDISLWFEQQKEFKKVVKELKSEGWSAKRRMFHGTTYLYSLRPPNDDRFVDAHLMKRSGNYIWTWAPGKKSVPSSENQYLISISKIYSRFFSVFFNQRRFPKKPIGLYQNKTWIHPQRYFTEIIELKNGISVPKKWDEYLTYRYGNWRIPDEEFSTHSDDGGLDDRPPYEIPELDVDI